MDPINSAAPMIMIENVRASDIWLSWSTTAKFCKRHVRAVLVRLSTGRETIVLRVTTFVHGWRDHCVACYYVCPRVERPLCCVLLRLSTGREPIVLRVTTFVHGWTAHCVACYYVCLRVESPLCCVLLRLSTGGEPIVLRVTTFVHG